MTPSGGQLDWAWEWTAWALCALAGLLALWALFWDRPRGRRRCPRCWYDLKGAAPIERDGRPRWVCPECGRETASERDQLCTRRRWRWTVLSLVLLLAAYAAFAMPRVLAAGKIGFVPTSGLVWWVSRYEPPDYYDRTVSRMTPPTAPAAELARRVAGGRVWGWQSRWMIDGQSLTDFGRTRYWAGRYEVPLRNVLTR